jgi:hypothetical protein
MDLGCYYYASPLANDTGKNTTRSRAMNEPVKAMENKWYPIELKRSKLVDNQRLRLYIRNW